MLNFVLGTIAGGVIACIATISAARNPDVQARLGLVPPAQAALASPPVVAERCPPVRASVEAATRADKLFEPRRFWFVAP